LSLHRGTSFAPAGLSTILSISDDDIKNYFRQLSKTGSHNQ
jgi:hypothetical protein